MSFELFWEGNTVNTGVPCPKVPMHRKLGLEDDSPLATDPRNNRGPIFVIMAPTRLTFLAATTRSTPQRLLPPMLGFPLLAIGVVEIICFDGPFQLTRHFIGQGSIP